MITWIGFFIVLNVGLIGFAWAMKPTWDRWDRQRAVARRESEGARMRMRLRARMVEAADVDWDAVHRMEIDPPKWLRMK